MAKSFVISNPARQAACDAIVNLMDAGTGATVSDCVIQTTASATLVSIPLGTVAFGNASTAGVASMTESSPTGVATGAGAAGRFVLQDQGNTEIANGNVGTTGTSFTMAITNTTIAVDDVVQLTAMTVTVPAGT